ncbi:MAG: glycoside hydrolase family 15 protein [Candidatus Acidiferrales bacterium]
MDAQSPVQKLIGGDYSSADLARLEEFLQARGTLTLRPQANGLFTAASGMAQTSATGYQDLWLRDNVMIASSFLGRGDVRTAVNTAIGLTGLMRTQEARFRKIIAEPAAKEDVQERPHVRFNLGGTSEKWSHAQNDALGYVLWLRFVLANAGHLPLDPAEFALYRLFPLYFRAIEFWNDPDSGAWEEDRKINSSSVGAVLAGLRAMQTWMKTNSALDGDGIGKVVEDLIREGMQRLQRSLPFESPPQRLADSAVLLLIHPADVLLPEQGDAVLRVVHSDLERQIGILRYAGDSYYGQDYPDWFSAEQLSGDFSNNVALRNAKLRPGFEAQWCIFDPLLSVIYGKRFLADRHNEVAREKQVHHFNRSLKQLSDAAQCPELYFFRHEKWIPNPHVPLAWTQANLALALHLMQKSAAI